MPKRSNEKTSEAKNVAATMPKNAEQGSRKKRLNLELTPEAYELLQRLAEESGKSFADILRGGLALYGIAQAEKRKGRGIGVIDDDTVIKELLLI